jgi:hypothetical protein
MATDTGSHDGGVIYTTRHTARASQWQLGSVGADRLLHPSQHHSHRTPPRSPSTPSSSPAARAALAHSPRPHRRRRRNQTSSGYAAALISCVGASAKFSSPISSDSATISHRAPAGRSTAKRGPGRKRKWKGRWSRLPTSLDDGSYRVGTEEPPDPIDDARALGLAQRGRGGQRR